MDCLLASYASSDEEDDHPQPPPQPPHQPPQPQPAKPTSSLFSSLPKPSSTSLFSSLPPPKPTQDSTFLPPPTSKPKRVVQFHLPPPKAPSFFDNEDDVETDTKPQATPPLAPPSVKSFLSSIPKPKHSSLGPSSSSSSSRRNAIDTSPIDTAPVPAPAPVPEESDVGVSDVGAHLYSYNNYNDQAYGNYSDQAYGSYDGSGWYDNNAAVSGAEAGMVVGPETSYGGVEVGGVGGGGGGGGGIDVERLVGMGGGKRRRDQRPPEIVEVKQDELMKNRPTEDKSRLTGIAFGPAYQPTSTKGKPSKLHKRKHQIGALYFDMRQKEMELAERRAKGNLTKAETHAKYGW